MPGLTELLQEHRALRAERNRVLAEYRETLAINLHIGAEFKELASQSLARLQAVRERARAAAPPALADVAMRAAISAYDKAFKAPSAYGLPSDAAVAAYTEILPEPEETVRSKLAAALALQDALRRH